MDAAQTHKQSLRGLRERFGFDFMALALVYGVNRPLLAWKHATASLNNEYQRIVLTPGQGVAGQVYKTGRGMVMQNAQRTLAANGQGEYLLVASERLESFVALPLWREDRVAGVLLGAFRTANQVTPGLFEAFLAGVTPCFCGFETRPAHYHELVCEIGLAPAGHEPVYALLTDHVIKAQEAERQRISRELHDGIVQEILSVQMTLRQVSALESRGQVLEEVARAERSLDAIQQQLRDMAVGLRPVTLDDLGLVAALRSHFAWVTLRHGVQVHLRENVGPARFELLLETVYYRVCQEAVLNACKYSGRDEVIVALTLVAGTLLLEVEDRGAGFTVNRPDIIGSGLGLRGMAERAEMIDGEFSIQSAPGKGTKLRLETAVQGGLLTG